MQTSAIRSPLDLVNLDRYPIHDLTSNDRKNVITDCQKQLAECGACVLPGFLKSEAIAQLIRQSLVLEPEARRTAWLLNTYSEKADKKYEANHPRRRRFAASLKTLAYDQIPKEDLINLLYECDAVTDFIRDALGLATLYRYTDEFQSLNITYMGDGDQLAWHYDLNDFVVTLLLQAPEHGGEFEYAPNIRNKDLGEENYPDVHDLFEGKNVNNKLMSQEPGTLVLFQGINSMHRVRCVYGPIQRITAIMGYHRQPDYKSKDLINAYLYGERAQKKLAKRQHFLKRWFIKAALYKARNSL